MATITRTVGSAKAAKTLINKCYEADKIGGLLKKGLAFAGSVITADTHKDGSNYVVTVSSNYYVASSLEKILL